jgi:hypothetical protein
MHVSWHEGHGFVVHCFEDGESGGFFLAATTSFSPPEIEIEMGGQAMEKWPRQLFGDRELAVEALLMTPRGLSINGLARNLRVPVTRVSKIVNGRRTASRLTQRCAWRATSP